jgi:hypothetical protein
MDLAPGGQGPNAVESGLRGVVGEKVDRTVRDLVVSNYMIVMLVLVILVIYLLYRMFYSAAESLTNPTGMMRGVDQNQANIASPYSDNVGRALAMVANQASVEHATGGPQGNGNVVSTVAGLQGLPAVTTATDPSSPMFPGSASWQVLNSPAFNCGGRDLTASSDAWGWMGKVARGEAMESGPSSDSKLTKVMAGL